MYTYNRIKTAVLEKALKCYSVMLGTSGLWKGSKGVLISAEPVQEPDGIKYLFENILADAVILNQGHLSILLKIEMAVNRFPSKFVSLHEHDVLYPAYYLVNIQQVIEAIPAGFDYIATANLIGVNRTGYVKRIKEDYPMSTLTFRTEKLKELIVHKKQEFFANKGWCFLEPGYGGSYGAHYKMIKLTGTHLQPAIHVNMNETGESHHFTDHFLTYEQISTEGFGQWPGDLGCLFG